MKKTQMFRNKQNDTQKKVAKEKEILGKMGQKGHTNRRMQHCLKQIKTTVTLHCVQYFQFS